MSHKTLEEMAEAYGVEKSTAYYMGVNDEKKSYQTARGQYAKEDFLAGCQAATDHIGDATNMVSGALLAIDYCEPILSDDYARAIGREEWIGTRCVKVGEGHELYKAFVAGYQAAKDGLTWVNVEAIKLLPEYGLSVLIYSQKIGEARTAIRHEQAEYPGYGWHVLSGRINYDEVTHWMPRIAPPEEKDLK